MDPYAAEHGGAVISTTINKFLNVSLYPRPDHEDETCVHALDLDAVDTFSPTGCTYDGHSDLVKATLKHFHVTRPLDIHIHSDLPPGSGMGTSSALTVALIGACARLKGQVLSNYAIARLAYHLEREELGQRGGYQDQYAAAFGGFNYIKFGARVTVYPLNLSIRLKNELRARLLLAFTGKTHLSHDIQQQVVQGYTQRKASYMHGMGELKRVAREMRDLLVQEDLAKLDEFGRLLHEGWVAKKSLSDKISTNQVEHIYLLAREAGAIGGKLLGAGGGGHVLLFINPLDRARVLANLEDVGTEFVPFEFEPHGVRVWSFEAEEKKK